MTILLLHFDGCPHVHAARVALREALAAEGMRDPVVEIDLNAADAPAWARGWGSPTILIDGQDVMGETRSPSADASCSCCRLYKDGAPSVDAIRARIAIARGA